MNRSQPLAFNAGVASIVAVARALAEDIRAKLAEDPERFAAAISALEVITESETRVMMPIPPGEESHIGGLGARQVTDQELAEELTAFLRKNVPRRPLRPAENISGEPT